MQISVLGAVGKGTAVSSVSPSAGVLVTLLHHSELEMTVLMIDNLNPDCFVSHSFIRINY